MVPAAASPAVTDPATTPVLPVLAEPVATALPLVKTETKELSPSGPLEELERELENARDWASAELMRRAKIAMAAAVAFIMFAVGVGVGVGLCVGVLVVGERRQASCNSEGEWGAALV